MNPTFVALVAFALALGAALPARGEITAVQTAKKLALRQVADDGAVTLTKTAAGDFEVSDGAGTATHAASPTLTLVLQDGSGSDVVVDLDSPLEADLVLDLGDGARSVALSGDDNAIGRDLRIRAGTGSQQVDLGVTSELLVGRHLRLELGGDVDSVDDHGRGAFVVGNVRLTGVDSFVSRGDVLIFGRLDVTAGKEPLDGTFDAGGSLIVSKTFKYRGSSGIDRVLLQGSPVVLVEGRSLIDLGDGLGASSDDQEVVLDEGLIIGKLVIRSGETSNADRVDVSATSALEGAVLIDLGEGTNSAILRGTFADTSIKYFGGEAADHLTYGMTDTPARLRAKLEGGDDVLTVEAGAVLDALWVDFGEGSDTFENLLGTLPPDAKLLNLP